MKLRYTNMKKEFPNIRDCFHNWFSFCRFWDGRLIKIGIKHHVLTIDLRRDWISDMKGKP